MPQTLNGHVPPQPTEANCYNKDFNSRTLKPNNQEIGSNDWSYATKELLDSLPQVWTRGLFYFLITFVCIALPWAMLSKVDETGTARGRLEPLEKTIRLDAPVTGTVEKISVKEGERVKAGQTLVELESELVRAELEQLQEKLEGQQNRLQQLKILQNQLQLVFNTQQQQTKLQELEKQAQVEQARQNLVALKGSYNLQKEEKLAQVNQARQNLKHSETAFKLADFRWAKAKREVQRYRQLWEKGVVPETDLVDKEESAKEKQQLQEQTFSDIEQAKLVLGEQQSSYDKILHQAQSDISQAQLRFEEQKRGYKSLVHSGKLAVLKSKEQIQNLETEITSLSAEVAQSKSQVASLQYQLAQRVIKAPVEGIIFELAIQRAGAVVQPGNTVAEIAPEGTSLILRAQMATTESGSLREGMPVKMKFDAYPFQDYGIVEGELIEISPTSTIIETQGGQTAIYELDIKFEKNCIPTSNNCVVLRPGDTATAEVIVHQRRVIDFILDPFKKLQKGGLEL